MATMFTRAEVFSTNLLVAMQRKNVSRRALARLISPDDPELGRSKVRRALRGMHEPTHQTLALYAEVLEVEPEELLPEETEEEAALDMARMVRDLESRVRQMKRAMKPKVLA
jgi:transcriptional regulator with XRE-family HTH domain